MSRTPNQSTQSTGTVDYEVPEGNVTSRLTEPRMPERVRLIRPAMWSEAPTATLSAESFRIYLGLATRTDDGCWTLWRLGTLAALLLPYQSVRRRERLVEKAEADLIAAGLLIVYPCGCAYLPFMWRDFRQAGGNHSYAVTDYHRRHASPDESVQPGTSPASVSVSGSGSVSGSASGSVSERSSHSVPDSAVGSGSGSGPTPSSDVQTNKENDDPWTRWNGKWAPVREAMARRGFYQPPNGETDEEGTQRDHLWQMVRENATLVAQIIDEAPAHLCAGQSRFFDLVGHIFKKWNTVASGGPS